MTCAAIALLVVSAVVHAVWNMIGKRENPTPVFFLQASAVGALCLLPVVAAHLPTLPQIPQRVWLLLGATGLCQAVYYCGLAGAYRSGHLSVAYPLARSMPVIMVAVVSLMMGKEKALTPAAIAGMGLIAMGSLALPVDKLSEWKLRDYLHPATLFALMAAVGTCGYSVVDDSALRLLRSTQEIQTGRVFLTLIYAFFEGVSAVVWMCLFVLVGRRRCEPQAKQPVSGWGSAALAGVGISFAYALVLLAMTYARDVSYVVAFRQLSIPMGAALGMSVLHEPCNKMKLLGISVMLVGLVLVAVR